MAVTDLRYSNLPDEVKDNLTEEQFELALPDVVEDGETVPETTQYIDMENGVIGVFHEGERANGYLLPTRDLSSARSFDESQFET